MAKQPANSRARLNCGRRFKLFHSPSHPIRPLSQQPPPMPSPLRTSPAARPKNNNMAASAKIIRVRRIQRSHLNMKVSRRSSAHSRVLHEICGSDSLMRATCAPNQSLIKHDRGEKNFTSRPRKERVGEVRSRYKKTSVDDATTNSGSAPRSASRSKSPNSG